MIHWSLFHFVLCALDILMSPLFLVSHSTTAGLLPVICNVSSCFVWFSSDKSCEAVCSPTGIFKQRVAEHANKYVDFGLAQILLGIGLGHRHQQTKTQWWCNIERDCQCCESCRTQKCTHIQRVSLRLETLLHLPQIRYPQRCIEGYFLGQLEEIQLQLESLAQTRCTHDGTHRAMQHAVPRSRRYQCRVKPVPLKQ